MTESAPRTGRQKLRKLTRITFILCILFFSQIITAKHHPRWKSAFFANIYAGNLHAYAQTPKGGDIGTTSFKRPDFRELSKKEDLLYELGARLQIEDYFAEFHFVDISPSAQDNLTQDLITHSLYIPVNSPFDMHVNYHWYSLWLGKSFHLPLSSWVLSPFITLDYLRYHYAFSSPSNSSIRAFTLLESQIGLKIAYDLTPCLKLELQGTQSLPLSNLTLSQGTLNLNYTLTFQHATFIPKVGLGFIRMDYEDEQTVPNHIHYTLSPFLTLGLTLAL